MPKQTITVQMDTDSLLRLRELAAQVRMCTRSYCAMVLDLHIQRKEDVDSNGEGAK